MNRSPSWLFICFQAIYSTDVLCFLGPCGDMSPSVGKRSRRERQKRQVIPPLVLLHEPKLCLLIYFFFSQRTPLILSAYFGVKETCRVLVASKADVAARDWCRSPWRARNLTLTPCVAATAKLHSKSPSTTTRPTLLHTFAVSAPRNDAAPPRQP
jgi:hypothetical protein